MELQTGVRYGFHAAKQQFTVTPHVILEPPNTCLRLSQTVCADRISSWGNTGRVQEPGDHASYSPRTGWLIRSLFGERHWCTPWVLGLSAADPQFLPHLAEQSQSYVHYLCVVQLALPHSDPYPTTVDARWLRETPRKAVLAQLYSPCPEGLLNVLSKLGGRPLSKNDYRKLIRLMHDKGSARFLRHARAVKPYHLAWLQEFPVEQLNQKLLESIRRSSDYNTLKYILRTVDAFAKGNPSMDHLRSLRRVKDIAQLETWFQKQLAKLDFPEPPWAGNEWIHPITTARRLTQLSYEFQNCLEICIRSVLLGSSYFYHSTQGPAIVLLRRDPLLHWQLNEINGPSNEPPKKTVTRALIEEFARAGFLANPLRDDIFRYDELWRNDAEF